MCAAHDESAIARRHGRALFEAVSDLVLVVNADGVYRAVKAESETELAAPPDRLVGRNLHDGAQQQLVFVSHALRLARAAIDREPARSSELLDRAVEGLDTAHTELRELARGLHPPLLAERGLPAALRAARRARAGPRDRRGSGR